MPSSARWRPLEATGPAAYGVPPHPGLPRGVVPVAPAEPLRITAPVAADAVVIGKFDHGRQARMRGFYADSALTIRVQAGSRAPGREHGVSRSVLAAQIVGAHRPGLMPAIVDHGAVLGRRTAYLVEEVVEGRAPANAGEVATAMPAVVEGLRAVQRTVGVGAEPLSAVVPSQFRQRWREVVADGHVPAGVADEVDHLISRDDRLEVSFTHGDLVTSNMLRVADRVVLIDWEHAGSRPIAFDLAKMHVNSGPPGPVLEVLAAALNGHVGDGRGHYSLAEQLALAHVVVLSRLEARMHKARQARRIEPLLRQTRKRVGAVRELLALRG